MNEQYAIPSRGRIDAFDFLRSLMIFFVIVLHASMTYMLTAPSWWYVVNDKLSPVFVIVVNVLDVFIMPVLFFISGYFTPASYLRKNTDVFLKDKLRHIFAPWILGIILLVPLFSVFAGKPLTEVFDAVGQNPLYLFHAQGHLWYLGVLFIFLMVYSLYATFFPPNKERTVNTKWENSKLILLFVVLSVIAATLSIRYITAFDNWISLVGIFMLKPAKIITYGCIFILGTYAWQKSWFTKDGWMPNINIWRILALTTMTFYMVLRLLIIPEYNFPFLNTLIPMLDAVCSFTTLFYMLLIGIRFQKNSFATFMINMSPYSYGIYWIHLPLMIFYLYLINDLNFPIIIKWGSAIVMNCILSWLLSKYVLKRIPLLRDMF